MKRGGSSRKGDLRRMGLDLMGDRGIRSLLVFRKMVEVAEQRALEDTSDGETGFWTLHNCIGSRSSVEREDLSHHAVRSTDLTRPVSLETCTLHTGYHGK